MPLNQITPLVGIPLSQIWGPLVLGRIFMKRIEAIAKEIVAREGGYVNDKADPGGATRLV